MRHELPKQLLEQASTFELRQKAIRAAMALGMPLNEIEAYLDWLDQQPAKPASAKKTHSASPATPRKVKTPRKDADRDTVS